MLFFSRGTRACGGLHLAAQSRDKSCSVARERNILAVRDVGLKHGRLSDVEDP
jgi:hypothetical protein